MFYATHMRLFSLPCLFCDFLNDLKSLYRFLLFDVFERCLHSELVHMTIIVLLVLVCENQFEFLVTNVGVGWKKYFDAFISKLWQYYYKFSSNFLFRDFLYGFWPKCIFLS